MQVSAGDGALKKVSEILKLHSYLDKKLSTLQTECKKRVEKRENAINKQVIDMLEMVRQNSKDIQDMSARVNEYMAVFGRKYVMYQDFLSLVGDYKNVKLISNSHLNFYKTKDLLERIAQVETETRDVLLLVDRLKECYGVEKGKACCRGYWAGDV